MSESKNCSQCGAPVDINAASCKYCGETFNVRPQQSTQTTAQAQPQVIIQQQAETDYTKALEQSGKSKMVAGLLGILLGSLGAHKFYLGSIGMGILYLVFCWTGIPSIVGLIEGIIYLVASDKEFYLKHVKK